MANMSNQAPLDCCLCEELSSTAFPVQYQEIYSVGSRICIDTDEFVVLPTLSPLAAGHVLVLPKGHVTNLAALLESSNRKLLACAETVSNRLAKFFGSDLYFFEHGVTGAGQACGIDHAHLHILPLPMSIAGKIESRIDEDFPSLHMGSLVDVLSLVHQMGAASYLLHGRSLLEMKVSVSGRIQSQYMRRMVADMLSLPEWDWKKLSAQAEFQSTLGAFRAF